MNADRKSDESVVPATPVNNGAAEAPAESVEERGSAKRNAEQSVSHRTPEFDGGITYRPIQTSSNMSATRFSAASSPNCPGMTEPDEDLF